MFYRAIGVLGVLGAPQSDEGFSIIFTVIHHYDCNLVQQTKRVTELLKISAETAHLQRQCCLEDTHEGLRLAHIQVYTHAYCC